MLRPRNNFHLLSTRLDNRQTKLPNCCSGANCDSNLPHDSGLPVTEQNRIYLEWMRAGRPHNFVCSECRKPDNLMLCETCCRSYHASCLPTALQPGAVFHCPSCKEKQWDRLPPQTPSSASVSRSTSPSTRGTDRTASPMSFVPQSDHGSPAALGATPSGFQRPCVRTPPDTVGHVGYGRSPGPASAGPDAASQARAFLVEHGGFPAHQEFRPDLLLYLGNMMKQLESQQAMLQELQGLKEENARLRTENAQMRTYVDSRLSGEHVFGSAAAGNLAYIPRPSPDTSGKSWDKIVMDLI